MFNAFHENNKQIKSQNRIGFTDFGLNVNKYVCMIYHSIFKMQVNQRHLIIILYLKTVKITLAKYLYLLSNINKQRAVVIVINKKCRCVTENVELSAHI